MFLCSTGGKNLTGVGLEICGRDNSDILKGKILCSVSERNYAEMCTAKFSKAIFRSRIDGMSVAQLPGALKARRSCRKIEIGEARMRANKHIDTTLGALIAAVTDEVMPIVGNQANADVLVSFILNDLLIAKRLRMKKRLVLKPV